MSFLDAAAGGEEAPPPAPAPQGGGGEGGGGGGPPPGGGPIIAALANRQRGPRQSAPGPGDMASSMSMLQQAIAMMNQALPGLMGDQQVYQDVLKALTRVSKHVPQGAPTAGVQKTHLTDMLGSLAKNVMLQMIMARKGQGGAPGGAQGGPPPAPMPSTPLPGA